MLRLIYVVIYVILVHNCYIITKRAGSFKLVVYLDISKESYTTPTKLQKLTNESV